MLRKFLLEGEYDLFDNDSGEKFWGNVGAGILPIAKDTGRILLPYRSKYVNEPHTWGVWGGKIESGENPKSAALREFKEETKYNGNIKLIDAYIFKAKGFSYYNFLGIIEHEFVPNLDWETETFKWVELSEINDLDLHFGLAGLLKNSKSLIDKTIKDVKKC